MIYSILLLVLQKVNMYLDAYFKLLFLNGYVLFSNVFSILKNMYNLLNLFKGMIILL